MMRLTGTATILLFICGSSLLFVGTGSDHVSPHVLSRQKRFIYFNTQTPVDVGLLITVPLSFALPSFTLSSSRRKRDAAGSFGSYNDACANMTSDDFLPSGSYDDAAYSEELKKLTSYFNVLEIDEDICQQRILCEMFTDAEKYKPMSDLFLKKLTVDRGTVVENATNRYFRYVQAMQNGIVSGEPKQCEKIYKHCPYSSEDRIHMKALRFWSFLMNMLRLEFRDE